MNECFKAVHYERKTGPGLYPVKRFGPENAKKVRAFHASFPEYSVTPLAKLDNLAKALGVANVYVKDESYRFGLNAFKVLGGSYTIGNDLAQKLGKDISELPFNVLSSEEVRKADRRSDLCYRHRWQPWPRHCLDCQPPGPEERCLYAQGQRS